MKMLQTLHVRENAPNGHPLLHLKASFGGQTPRSVVCQVPFEPDGCYCVVTRGEKHEREILDGGDSVSDECVGGI